MKSRWKICFFAFFFPSSQIFAIFLEPRFFLNSGRAISRGGFHLTQMKDTMGFLGNPAQLSFAESLVGDVEAFSPLVTVSQDMVNLVQILTNGSASSNIIQTVRQFENNVLHFGLSNYSGLVLKHLSFGVLEKTFLNTGFFWDPVLGSTTFSAHAALALGAHVSSAFPIIENRLHWGITGKMMSLSSYANQLSIMKIAQMANSNDSDLMAVLTDGLRRGTAVGLDSGLLLNYEEDFFETQMGLVVRNLGQTYRWVPEGYQAPDPDRMTLDWGGSVAFRSESSRLTLGLDFKDLLFAYGEKIFKHIAVGSELDFANFFGFGLGLFQGYWSYGLFANFKFLRLDAGVFSVELGDLPGEIPNQRLFLQLKMGWFT